MLLSFLVFTSNVKTEAQPVVEWEHPVMVLLLASTLSSALPVSISCLHPIAG